MSINLKISLFFILLCFVVSSGSANVAISNSFSGSLSVSSEQQENDEAYLLIIKIEGVDPRRVTFDVRGQTLVLEALQGFIRGNAMVGGQSINYSYLFSEDADMNNISRVDLDEEIRITIPRW